MTADPQEEWKAKRPPKEKLRESRKLGARAQRERQILAWQRDLEQARERIAELNTEAAAATARLREIEQEKIEGVEQAELERRAKEFDKIKRRQAQIEREIKKHERRLARWEQQIQAEGARKHPSFQTRSRTPAGRARRAKKIALDRDKGKG